MTTSKMKHLPFDKYDLYKRAVQSPDDDVLFYLDRYKDIRGKPPKSLVLREDFCGTGAISCEWVKLNKNYKSVGLDLDNEPMAYGRREYISKLTPEQQGRILLVQKNVLETALPKADIVVAVNFSYFLFKKRETLRDYFTNVYNSLPAKGLFMIDIFGGTRCTDAIVDTNRHKGFTYYWNQKFFDPVTTEAAFSIDFRYKGKVYKNVFTYDWRMWSIQEVREIMIEAGFKETQVYWEGTNRQGGGNGIFKAVEKGEACLSWIAYVAGIK